MPQINKDEADRLILELQALQRRAYGCGLYVTARGINRAMNAAGWELAADIEKAGQALNTDHT